MIYVVRSPSIAKRVTKRSLGQRNSGHGLRCAVPPTLLHGSLAPFRTAAQRWGDATGPIGTLIHAFERPCFCVTYKPMDSTWLQSQHPPSFLQTTNRLYKPTLLDLVSAVSDNLPCSLSTTHTALPLATQNSTSTKVCRIPTPRIIPMYIQVCLEAFMPQCFTLKSAHGPGSGTKRRGSKRYVIHPSPLQLSILTSIALTGSFHSSIHGEHHTATGTTYLCCGPSAARFLPGSRRASPQRKPARDCLPAANPSTPVVDQRGRVGGR